jgi:hypothetical protein
MHQFSYLLKPVIIPIQHWFSSYTSSTGVLLLTNLGGKKFAGGARNAGKAGKCLRHLEKIIQQAFLAFLAPPANFP